MRLYAKPGRLMAGQIAADLGTVLWVVLWIYLGGVVRNLIIHFGDPFRSLASGAEQMSESMAETASSMAGVPLVGEALSKPFDAIAGSLQAAGGQANQAVTFINGAAQVIALVVIIAPIVIWVWKWLPWRIRFIYQATRAAKVARSAGGTELFALRALATAPMSQLAKIAPNPWQAWQAGDEKVIRRLAGLGLAVDGLGLSATKPAPSGELPLNKL